MYAPVLPGVSTVLSIRVVVTTTDEIKASGPVNSASGLDGHTRLNGHATTYSGFLRPSRVPPPRIDLSAASMQRCPIFNIE